MTKHQLEQEIIASYAEAYNNFGLSSLMGKIVALLIISPEPQSLDDISERLEMSKGPISQICRRLKERNLIEKAWVPGDRKDYYQPVNDIFKQAFRNQAEKMRRNIDVAERYWEASQEVKGADYIRERMAEMKDFYELLEEHNKAFIAEWEKVRKAK
jgi:DNA-binding transcriptional regulator GbsR (MarR family)